MDTSDIDLIFFNAQESSKQYEKEIELALIGSTGLKNISVKNQARITTAVDGRRHDDLFKSVESFPDVTVAAAARIFSSKDKVLSFFIPYGLTAIEEKIVRPTSVFLSNHVLRDFYVWVERKKYGHRLRHWQIETAPRKPLSNTMLYLCQYCSCKSIYPRE